MNRKTCSSSRSRGRSAVRGWIGFAFLCLHSIHLDFIFANKFCNETIQNFRWRMFLKHFVPSFRLSHCVFSNRRSATGCFAVNSIVVLVFWHSNQSMNVSVDVALYLLHPPLWRVTIWRCSIFWRFVCYLLSTLKHWGSFLFEQIGTVFAWWMLSALRGSFCFPLNLMQ